MLAKGKILSLSNKIEDKRPSQRLYLFQSAHDYGRCVVSYCVEVLTEITSVFIGLISTTFAWYGSSLHTGALSLMSRMVMFT